MVDHGPVEPHRVASDIDLRSQVSATLREKNIRVRWIPRHRKTSSARDAQELDDIKRNNEVDLLAKLATSLPLPIHNPTGPSSISDPREQMDYCHAPVSDVPGPALGNLAPSTGTAPTRVGPVDVG